MLETQLLRTLMVAGNTADAVVRPLSAASGLVQVGNCLYVVADDEDHLGVFNLTGHAPGQLLRLFDEAAPSVCRTSATSATSTTPATPAVHANHSSRKARKRDLESLTLLPPFAGCPHGALLALGSGSRPNRQLGALLPLAACGQPTGAVQVLDLQPLFAPLHTLFSQVNIEGAFVDAGCLCLLQRGHLGDPVSACVRLELQAVLRALAAGAPAAPVQAVQRFDLGCLGGVPLTFTDGAALAGGGWAFSAAAEATSDAYADGFCVGSAVGWVNAAGVLQAVQPLRRICKAEGISVQRTAEGWVFQLVTDADDRQVPAQLLTGVLAGA